MDTKSDNEVVKEEVKLFKGFKKHLLIFLAVLAILWTTWFITGNSPSLWPLYPSMLWVIILTIHFITAYRGIEKRNKDIN
jgi:Methyladenine glycosylase/2TM domain